MESGGTQETGYGRKCSRIQISIQSPEHVDPVPSSSTVPSQSFTGRRALVFSPVPTHPTTHGNRTRVVAMISFLQQVGFDVHVAILPREDYDETAMHAAYGSRLHLIHYTKPPRRESMLGTWLRRVRQIVNPDMRYALGGDDWYDDASDAPLRALEQEFGFDLVMVEYAFMSRALLQFRSAGLTVIDTHDLFANRHRLFLESGMEPHFYSTTPQEEQRCLARADLVLGIQDQETEQIRREYGLDALTFGHTIRVEPLFGTRDPEYDLLFVGSGNDMNIQGFLWFAQDVLPILTAAQPDLRIVAIGGVCACVPDFPGVTKLGVVADLTSHYAKTRLAINPVRMGTGLNIKSVEAMGFGIPLLSTESGARGLEQAVDNKAMVVADTAEEFARTALRLTGDADELQCLSRQCLAFARHWNEQNGKALVERLAATLNRPA